MSSARSKPSVDQPEARREAHPLPIRSITVSAYTIPTDQPEADGTIEWDSTTLIVVEAEAGGCRGLGYGYADMGAARLIAHKLIPLIEGRDAWTPSANWHLMAREVRNIGRPGIASMAISAVDVALWDLKAKLLGLPLVSLIGRIRAQVPAYGSGGFTNYSDERLTEQFTKWAELGLRAMKMKVGTDPDRDPHRVQVARAAIGPDIDLFVDANGGYPLKTALELAEVFAEERVCWFEEPVSSDNLTGLHLMVERAPAGMEIAAGEYGFDPIYFRKMLQAEAVDVLQADGTRCGGVTGFLYADALAEAFDVPLSAHTAPTLHGHLGCACKRVRNVEYFHDHARIERMLFEGALIPTGGDLTPDPSAPGMGLEFRRTDADRFAV